LVNSITGYKSAHLIGSQSLDGKNNVAIFSSVIHLGSNPALIGFILRPTSVPRHTYSNIKATGIFTLNAITKKQIKDAHHTSAKYPEEISEFDKTNLQIEKKEDWNAPFVKDVPIQMGCRYQNEYHIKENDTKLIVASIEHFYVSESLLLADGWVQLDKGNIVAINGLDGYADPKLLERFPYARPKS
jgi:flavin reductase (DIM6/NTAB) family NADH-FMN oxidoreductase RutF